MCINNSFQSEKPEIVLFNSPIYRDQYDDGEDHLPPLGQGYIVTKLKENGISALLIDCVYEHLGVSEVTDIINRGCFFNVGFNIFSTNMALVRDILSGISRKINIFLGGRAIEHLWAEILGWDINYPITFVIGEGEKIIPDLILQKCKDTPIYSNGFHKVYLVNKNSSYYPADLNQIYLDRTLFKGREILNKYNRYEACIIASRGCIYDCAFCGGAVSANPNITARTRGYNSLANEINEIIEICPKVESIRILDDLFLYNRQSIISACTLFSLFPQLHWRCMAHVNTFVQNLDLLDNLKISGCDEVFIGIESGSEEIRKIIHKVGTVQDVINVICRLVTAGIHVKGYFICGFPDETEAQLKMTLNLAATLHSIARLKPGDFHSVVFQFRPYHGTELFNMLSQTGATFNFNQRSNLPSCKHQYSFSAGNFSNVSDEVLKRYIEQIMQYNG